MLCSKPVSLTPSKELALHLCSKEVSFTPSKELALHSLFQTCLFHSSRTGFTFVPNQSLTPFQELALPLFQTSLLLLLKNWLYLCSKPVSHSFSRTGLAICLTVLFLLLLYGTETSFALGRGRVRRGRVRGLVLVDLVLGLVVEFHGTALQLVRCRHAVLHMQQQRLAQLVHIRKRRSA